MAYSPSFSIVSETGKRREINSFEEFKTAIRRMRKTSSPIMGFWQNGSFHQTAVSAETADEDYGRLLSRMEQQRLLDRRAELFKRLRPDVVAEIMIRRPEGHPRENWLVSQLAERSELDHHMTIREALLEIPEALMADHMTRRPEGYPREQWREALALDVIKQKESA